MLSVNPKFTQRLGHASCWFILLLLAGFAREIATAQTLSFVPGQVSAVTSTNNATGNSDPNYTGPASGLLLNNAQGLTYDSQGNLFLVDAGSNVVRVIASGKGSIPSLPSVSSPVKGNVYTVAGSGSNTPSSTPLCGSGKDQQSSADSYYYGNGCPATAAILGFSLPAGGPSSEATPNGQVALDASGNLYIADVDDNQVRVVYAAGTVPGLPSGLTPGNIYGLFGAPSQGNPVGLDARTGYTGPPTSLAIDPFGDVWIAYGYSFFFGNNLGTIGVVVGSGSGTLPKLVEPRYLKGTTLTPGESLPVIPVNGEGQGQWNNPAAVASDSFGNIYVTDSNYGTNLVYVLYAGGNVPGLTASLQGQSPMAGSAYTFAGSGSSPQAYGLGVPATDAMTTDPGQISLDSVGDFYIGLFGVTNYGNSYIAKVDTTGNLALVAGSVNFDSTTHKQIVCATAIDGFGDGCPANQVAIYGPFGVTPAPNGDLYYADRYYNSGTNTTTYALHRIDASTSSLQLTTTAGKASAIQVASIANVGSQTLQISAIQTVGSFDVVPSGGNTDCSAPISLAPGQNCQLGVQLPASPGGSYSGSITITSNSTNATASVNTITLTGTASQVPSTTALTSSNVLVNVNQPVTLTATIAGQFKAPFTATGAVNFLNGSTSVGTAAVSNNVATLVLSTLPAGTYNLTASYAGDSSYSPSISYPVSLVVSSKPVPIVTLSSSASTAPQGQSVTFTATVAPYSGTTTPTGSVTFTDGTNALSAAMPLNGSGIASFSTSTLPAGANSIYAVYGGDSNYVAASSTGTPVEVQANALLIFEPAGYSIFAGTLYNQGNSGDNGPATSAQTTPTAASIDPSGNVFISDSAGAGLYGAGGPDVRVVASGKGVIAGLQASLPVGTTITPGNIYTFAGGSNGHCSGGNCGDGGQATQAKLATPSGVWADNFGNVYIADSGTNSVRKVNTSGIISTVAGNANITPPANLGDGGPATSATLANPNGIRVDSGGNLYIADSGNNLVRRVDAESGIINTIAGSQHLGGGYSGDGSSATIAQLNNPTDISLDAAGNLYIADTNNNVVRRIDAATGVITTVAGTGGKSGYSGDGGPATSATLSSPAGVYLDPAGDIYIADKNNGAVRRVDAVTGMISTVPTVLNGGGSTHPTEVALDSLGNLFVTDRNNDVVDKLASGGTPTMNFGYQQLGATPSQAYNVSNAGAQPLNVSAISFPNGFVQQASGGFDCNAPMTLNPGKSCALTVEFFPTSGSTSGTAYSGNVTIASNSANAASGVNSIAVSGTAQNNTGTSTQSITFTAPSTATYGQTLSLNGAASSGLPVIYLVSGPGRVAGNMLTVTGVGTVSVTAYQFGDNGDAQNANGWAAATPVQATITAQPAQLTVTADNFSQTPGTVIPTLTYTITGFANGDTQATATTGVPTLSTTATASSPQGTYPITITQNTLKTTTANYTLTAASFVNGTFTITQALPQAITFTQILPTVTYGAAPINLTATASSGLQVVYTVRGNATITGSFLSITGAGPIAVTATQPGDITYTAAQPVTQSFLVQPAPLTLTASNLTMAQGSDVPTLTYIVGGLVNGDTAANAVSSSPLLTTTATSSSPVGTYPITIAQGSLALSTNYTLTPASFVNGTMTVVTGKSQTITFGALPNVIYGVAPVALSATASSGALITFSIASGPASITNNLLSVTGAGTVTVTAAQGGNATYTAATPVQQSFTVAQAPLTVTANNITRVNDTPNPPLTYSVTGFVNGDTAAVISGSPILSTIATPSSPVGTYSISVAGVDGSGNPTLSANNYVFTNFVSGTFTITPGGPAQSFTMTVSTPSLTILDGHFKQTSISITPLNYYQGVLLLSCKGLPANASCTFSPATLNVTLNYSGSSGSAPLPIQGTLTVSTSSAPIVGLLPPSDSMILRAAIGGLMSLLFGIAFTWQRKRLGRYRSICALALAASLCAMATSLTACGSSSHASGFAVPGTSTVQVVATDANGGPTNSIPMVITIQ